MTLCCATARADLLDEARTVRPALARKYAEAYAQVEIDAIEKSLNDSAGRDWIQNFKYKRNGDLFAAVGTTVHTDIPSVKSGRIGVVAVNRDYRFTADKAAASAKFSMGDFKSVKDDETEMALEMSSCRPLFAYGYLDTIPVDDLLTGKADYARPTAASETTLDGKKVIKVEVYVKAEGGNVQWQLYFLPTTWALAGATQRFVDGPTLEYRIVYTDDDPLRMKSYRRWIALKDQPQVKKALIDTEVTSISFHRVPESEFRLAAFGLEEPALQRLPSPRAKMLWVNAAVFAALGVVLAVLSIRHRRRSGARAGAIETKG
jgi:hypothetical protein